jgi:hypothetical protein
LNTSWDGGTHVSFLSLEGIVSVFPIYYIVVYRFVIYSLYNVEAHSFCS